LVLEIFYNGLFPGHLLSLILTAIMIGLSKQVVTSASKSWYTTSKYWYALHGSEQDESGHYTRMLSSTYLLTRNSMTSLINDLIFAEVSNYMKSVALQQRNPKIVI
jgi:hypothetical protein